MPCPLSCRLPPTAPRGEGVALRHCGALGKKRCSVTRAWRGVEVSRPFSLHTRLWSGGVDGQAYDPPPQNPTSFRYGGKVGKEVAREAETCLSECQGPSHTFPPPSSGSLSHLDPLHGTRGFWWQYWHSTLHCFHPAWGGLRRPSGCLDGGSLSEQAERTGVAKIRGTRAGSRCYGCQGVTGL